MEKKTGYKGFRLNDKKQLICRDMVFAVGEIAEVSGKPQLCNRGIHFCWNLNDINDYYDLRSSVIGEVEILGEIVNQSDMKKSCTNKLRVVRVLTKEEVLKISNTGCDNTGYINTGNWNTGNWNTGNCNTGNWNTGNWNTGNWNTGNRNTGNCNTGDWNTGYWNTGNRNTGFFNTLTPKCNLFDKISNMTVEEFYNSKYMKALCSAPFILTEWVYYTADEKESDKAKELIGGYLKKYDYKDACRMWWNKLTDDAKKTIQDIPNFDKEKFFKITGIEVTK